MYLLLSIKCLRAIRERGPYLMALFEQEDNTVSRVNFLNKFKIVNCIL